MADVLTARLSEEIDAAELIRMWESQGLEVAVPEIVFNCWGRFISLRFQGGKTDPGFRKLKGLFEIAVRRYRPDCQIEWLERSAMAS